MSVHNINYLDNTHLCVPFGLIIRNNNLLKNNSEINPILINEKMLKEDIYDKLLNLVKYDTHDLYDTNNENNNKKTNKKIKKNKKLTKKNHKKK